MRSEGGTGPARDGEMEGEGQWEKGGAVCGGWVEESARRGRPERTRDVAMDGGGI